MTGKTMNNDRTVGAVSDDSVGGRFLMRVLKRSGHRLCVSAIIFSCHCSSLFSVIASAAKQSERLKDRFYAFSAEHALGFFLLSYCWWESEIASLRSQ